MFKKYSKSKRTQIVEELNRLDVAENPILYPFLRFLKLCCAAILLLGIEALIVFIIYQIYIYIYPWSVGWEVKYREGAVASLYNDTKMLMDLKKFYQGFPYVLTTHAYEECSLAVLILFNKILIDFLYLLKYTQEVKDRQLSWLYMFRSTIIHLNYIYFIDIIWTTSEDLYAYTNQLYILYPHLDWWFCFFKSIDLIITHYWFMPQLMIYASFALKFYWAPRIILALPILFIFQKILIWLRIFWFRFNYKRWKF